MWQEREKVNNNDQSSGLSEFLFHRQSGTEGHDCRSEMGDYQVICLPLPKKALLYQQGRMSKGKLLEIIVKEVDEYLEKNP